MGRTRIMIATLIAATLVLTACEYKEVDGVGTRTFDEELPPQDDLTSFVGCSRTDLGQWLAEGTVTNHTPDMATYAVTVAFYDDDTRLDERTLWIRDLRPAEVGDLNKGWWMNRADDVTRCDVLSIDRFTTPIVTE